MNEKRRCQRYLIQLPVEYWETDDAVLTGVVFNVSEMGLLIYSTQDMAIGKELTIKISYSLGDDFETIHSLAKIVWKNFQQDKSQRGYKYGLEFVRISPQDRQKLKQRIILRQKEFLPEGFGKEAVRVI